ncbi:thiol-activated cytolysin family protein [Chitinophaga nivalis]|uniref:Thiol-activated cytolysin family protein n=1 Tax=Chitinophaga nivalis TaxID=2991709 RepID=A0ABT3IM34_9BACT|nr:thiol-activated cytolysin family protein [Chitinophaga nivalis]MCW3465276.1 thiol-activated cytolysin family protein [Chitinophaga nivalis]MCW3485032.1 thiol-activated cytolysin family protein [Chitinophaga nivalis]
MKIKYCLLAAVGATFLLISSCKKDQVADNPQQPIRSFRDLKKIPNGVVNVNSGGISLKDFLDHNKKSTIEFLKDSIWPDGIGKSLIFLADEQVAPDNQLRYIYPGSLLQADGISNLRYVPIAKYQSKVKPITVSISAPGQYVSSVIAVPSLSATRNFIGNVFGNVTGTQLSGFEFNMTQFTYYDELKLAFGANVNVGNIFSVGASYGKEKIQSKTGLVAKFIQKNFSLDMDIPANGELLDSTVKPSDLGPYSPLYVSSITYGRLGVIKVESEEEYSAVKFAFNVAFKAGIVGAGVTVDAETKRIITNSLIQVKVIGGEGDEVVKTIVGYDEFRKFIQSGGNYSAQAPGFPLYFTLSHLSDHSVYSTLFNVNISNK